MNSNLRTLKNILLEKNNEMRGFDDKPVECTHVLQNMCYSLRNFQ